MTRSTSFRGWLRRALSVALLVSAILLTVASPVFGHVDLESSSPSDGTVVTDAPELIELRFTSDAVPAGDGVVLASADGSAIDVTVTQPEPTIVQVVPAEPLSSDVYGVLWTMKAGDAHPETGTITFQVDAPVPVPVEDGSTSGSTASIEEPIPESVTREAEANETSAEDAEANTPAESAASATAQGPASTDGKLDPVFDLPSTGTSVGDWLARIGRWVAMTGALVGIGAFAFAATALVGTRREVNEAGFWVRRAGILVFAGTIAEVIGVSIGLAGSVAAGLAPSSVVEVLAGSFGIAVVLRLVGGATMTAGTANVVSVAATPMAARTMRSAAAPAYASDVVVLDPPEPTYRLDVHRERVALIGIGLVAAAFLFDGHTVTAAPNLLVRSASAVHVLAAGVWVGGVLLMAWTLGSRHRRSVPLDAASMAIRFSRIASVALAGVAIAGTALAVAILDSLSELFTTPWGRALILKVLAVCVAAGIGAYNHFFTVPTLHANPKDEAVAGQLRQLVRIEGTILLIVVAVTAMLIGLAS